MKTIEGIPLPVLPVTGLIKVRDLVYFDGPLLTQYVHPNGDDYLKYWCDCDQIANRWMILRVNEASVLRLINRFVPLDYVIPKGCRDEFVYIVDESASKSKVNLVRLENLPSDYLPEAGAFLDKPKTRRDSKSFSVIVEGGWSVRALGEFPTVFAKAYSLLYNLNVLNVPNFTAHPWRGGFSSLHFFNWLARRIPSEDKPSVSAMQYASPGFMRFKLNANTAEQVTQCVADYKNNKAGVNGLYAELASYIRKHKLNDIKDTSDGAWPVHNDFLEKTAIDLLNCFTAINQKLFVQTSARSFETAKIAMAFYRYVKELAAFDSDGLVRFPNLEDEL